MPRNMSFSMTTQAVLDETKTVTRRLGWDFLKPGDLLWPARNAKDSRRARKSSDSS